MIKGKEGKGKFTPRFPKKYKGDPTQIIVRSGYEARLMRYLDENTNVLEWMSEEFAIPYRSPVDGRIHRYFPDFFAKVKMPDGSIKYFLMEVKPFKQTIEPKIPKRKTKNFLIEVATYGVNMAKFAAATEYCKDRGWEFRVITENELGIPNK